MSIELNALSAGPDRKQRFGGILETPWVSRVQRALLDAGRVQGLRHFIKSVPFRTGLDVGCGLWEGAQAVKRGKHYLGIDNSYLRVLDAVKSYPESRFIVADARKIPLDDKSFDLCMMIDTSHHLSDEEFMVVLKELKRVSRKYVLISDPILTDHQGEISQFFYRLDRGACFRTSSQMLKIVDHVGGLKVLDSKVIVTFPGLYRHFSVVMELF